MSSKEDLLRQLSIKKLRELAQENRVVLLYENWLGGKYTATTKDEIIDVLNRSRKVSKKKVENKVFGTSGKKISTKGKEDVLKRTRLAKAQKTMILKSQNFKCAKCRCDISKITPHFDHRIPLAIGGSHTLTNIQALCGTCHTEKTAFDKLEISRAKQR
jgi:5-methylcytosine-specific restriction endonuclease McrA